MNELVRPSENALSLVREWLHEHVDPEGISYSPANDFLSFSLPVAEAEKLLDTKYSVYRHTDGSTLVRTTEWSLPLHLHEHVEAVQPTTAFLRAIPQSKTFMTVPDAVIDTAPVTDVENPTVDKACNASSVTPLCLRTLYGT